MDIKIACLFIVLLGLVFQTEAEFFYNPDEPKDDELEARGIICKPGRTFMKVQKKLNLEVKDSEESTARRSHMNMKTKDESCQICVCSTAGKDIYCSNRSARNVNECMRMAKINDDYNKNIQFDHERSLFGAIRRGGDYLWHNDEIPYESNAKCKRGFSYYSNSRYANDTDIDVPDDIHSLLDYTNTDVCFYCVCATDGASVGCITRDQWICEYYKEARHQPSHAKERYANMFQQDRPSYFRSLPFRVRRTMDVGISEYVENGGDTLCCSHPDGHRRKLQAEIRNRVRQMRRKTPKENLLTGGPVNRGLITLSCVPFLSEYNDCGSDTTCAGCNRCTCNVDGQWSCYRAFDTCSEVSAGMFTTDDQAVNSALNQLVKAIGSNTPKKPKGNKWSRVPPAPKEIRKLTTTVTPLDFDDLDTRIAAAIGSRIKRSVNNKPRNDTEASVKFYNIVDDVDEDTLKHSNASGTIEASKVDMNSGKASRRTGVSINSSHSPLHIEYNQPKIYNDHIADNKIDSSHTEDKYDTLNHEKLNKIRNYTQYSKDKDLSKVVVNELEKGSETIGDPNGPIMSNITFTPENDTLTAMAFIAGNLLNKLWNIEKDSTDDSIETEVMKHQKIADLLDLFKEPMTYRQEQFLKQALEKLSDAVNKNKDVSNISLCNTFDDLKKDMNSSVKTKKCDKNKINSDEKDSVTGDALSKINNVLSLIKKFENVQKSIRILKNAKPLSNLRSEQSSEPILSKDEKGSLDVFGNILEKITNLLIPDKNKKIRSKIRNQNIFSNTPALSDQVKKAFDIDLDKTKLTPKDKLVLDYITKIQTSPCLLSSQLKEGDSIRNIESGILLNLSEFFKIKSFSDLLKIVNPESAKTQTTTTTTRTTTTTQKVLVFPTTEVKETKNNITLSLKDKLKTHLRTIIYDLIEIQNEKGGTLKPGDVNIADALPCLFKMLSEDKSHAKPIKYSRNDMINKIKSVLEVVRKENKKMPASRRNMVNTGPRPKSAVVWERVVKNLDQRTKIYRRNFNNDELKSYEDVKKIMERIESENSNTYKGFAYSYEVPAAEKLVLLLTLELDVKKYIDVLEKLQMLNNEHKLPADQLENINEFVHNAAANINLNERILKTLDKPKQKRFKIEKNSVEKLPVITSLDGLNRYVMKAEEETINSNDNFQISRDQVLNQLIRNRVELYLRMKEAQTVDLNGDIKYNIAQRIVANLENGNHKLAQELFKVFVDNKRPRENSSVLSSSTTNTRFPNLMALKQPLSQFQESKSQPWLTQDLLLKQLFNMKNLK